MTHVLWSLHCYMKTWGYFLYKLGMRKQINVQSYRTRCRDDQRISPIAKLPFCSIGTTRGLLVSVLAA